MSLETKLILLGAGGHAKSCIDVIESTKKYTIIGLINKHINNKKVIGYPIVGDDSDLSKFLNNCKNAFIGFGQIKSSRKRAGMYRKLKAIGYNIPKIISPYAYVSKHSKIGEGSIIMHGAIVNADSRIGKNSIINSNTLIEHDTTIGDHCHISTNTVINGEVEIGDNSFVGSNTVLKQQISIGSNCVIDAGMYVKKNIKDGSLIKNE